MWIWTVLFIMALFSETRAVHYPNHQASEMEEITPYTDNSSSKPKDTSEQDEAERELEIEKPVEENRDKDLLREALKTVLNPDRSIPDYKKENNVNIIIDNISAVNTSLEMFIQNMDKISLDSCQKTQEELWLFLTDNLNEEKKKSLTYAASQEDEVKKRYWSILKTQYLSQSNASTNANLRRRIRIIREKGINILMPESKERNLISSMQKTWNNALVCAYNSHCGPGDIRTVSDMKSTFKTSNVSEELRYYWKNFRDATGGKVRPVFEQYVSSMNNASKHENFSDYGDLWRFTFDDEEFLDTVERLWTEVKPLYKHLHQYVKSKLKQNYEQELDDAKDTIPAHLLGNMWAQEWQSIYHLVTPYPAHPIMPEVKVTTSYLFEAVDDFFHSLGFPSFTGEISGLNKKDTSDCLPTSQDMCNGTFRIHWCGEQEPIMKALPRIARLMGHSQYSVHYAHQPLVFRNGPTPAFPEAISSLAATQVTSPEQLKRFRLLATNVSSEHFMNHLLWKALEKLPLIGYAYVLDSWRWNVFSGTRQDWNQLWWDLRVNETGISAPVSRNQSDLDPASKYHVVSNVQYITYLISHVLEFQLLLALCQSINHTGPLHQCLLYDFKTAGTYLSKGMALGASEDWRTVLEAMSREKKISTKGILEYFKPLEEFLIRENIKSAQLNADMGNSIPIVIGVISVILTLAIIIAYCLRKKDLRGKLTRALGMSQNGTLNIASNEIGGPVNINKISKVEDCVKEDKL